jgi:hypothetical protein
MHGAMIKIKNESVELTLTSLSRLLPEPLKTRKQIFYSAASERVIYRILTPKAPVKY